MTTPPDNSFWDDFQDLRENSERKLINDIETAMADHPKQVANLLRGWMRSDKDKDKERRPQP